MIIELAAVKSCLLRVAGRDGRWAPSRAPWRAHGEEDEGVHFVKSALNVRFDGFCVPCCVLTFSISDSDTRCDTATNVRITNYPRSARRRSATSTARLRSCPVRTLRRLHPDMEARTHADARGEKCEIPKRPKAKTQNPKRGRIPTGGRALPLSVSTVQDSTMSMRGMSHCGCSE